MFEVRVVACPTCGEGNGVDGDAAASNETAGAELWGSCWHCGGEFQVSVAGRIGGVAVRMMDIHRSPSTTPLAFPMWRPTGHSL